MPQIPRARRTEKPVSRIDTPKADIKGAGSAALTAAGMGAHLTDMGAEMRKQELKAESAERAMNLSLMQRDLIDQADALERDPDVLEATGDRHEGLYHERLDNYAQGVIDNTEDPLLRDEFFKVYDQVGVKYRARARTEAHAKRVDHIATGLIELENKLTDAANPNNYKSLTLELAAAYSAQVKAGMLDEKYAATRNDAWVDATVSEIEDKEEKRAWANAADDPESFLAHTDWSVDEDDWWVKTSDGKIYRDKNGRAVLPAGVNLTTAEGEALGRQKDAKSYTAYGKKGYAWIYDKDPAQVLRIRAWAKSMVKARGQGSSNSSTMIDFMKRADLSSRGKGDGPLLDDKTKKDVDIEGLYLALGTKTGDAKAKIYREVEKPLAEEFNIVTNSPYASGLQNDDKTDFQVDFQYLSLDKKLDILENNVKPEAGSLEHAVASQMYEEMVRGVHSAHAAAVRDPAGATAPEVLKHYDDALSPVGIEYAKKLQQSMGIMNKKIVSNGFKSQFMNKYKAATAQQKLEMMLSPDPKSPGLKTRVKGYWPQVVKEMDMTTMDIVAAEVAFDAPEEAREILQMDALEEKDIPLKDEKDKKSIREATDSRFHNSDLGKALVGQLGSHRTAKNREQSSKYVDNLRSNIYKMAMMDRSKGMGTGAAVQKAINFFQSKHSYLVEDDAYYVILPKGEDSTLIRDGLTYARTNKVGEDTNWKELMKKYTPAIDIYSDVLAEGLVDYVRRAGVWMNVAGSNGKLYMLVDQQTGAPILKTDGELYTVDIAEAKEYGKALRTERREWQTDITEVTGP